MKPSQIAILLTGGVLAGLILLTAVIGRVAVSQMGVAALGPGERVTGSADLTGFSGIEIEGTWRVEVTRGDDWRVELTYPERLADGIEVDVRGDRLRLSRDEHGRWFSSDEPARAVIVMPALEELEVAGASQLDVSGFDGARLEVHVAGAVELRGRDGRYDDLELSVAGASDIDLRGIVVTSAEIDLAGASDVILTMNGGELTGEMAGAGNIEYYGSVSREAVRVVGFGSVARAE